MTHIVIQNITTEQYHKLIANAVVLEKDYTAPKVLKLIDGSFLKLFRRKRWFSSELIYPYAKRFADNAQILASLEVAAPCILNLYRFKTDTFDFTAVQYEPLPGETLRHMMQQASDEQKIHYMKLFAKLLFTLHQHGIYFRSLHLGNVLVMPNGQLGLIDFADMTKQRAPLSQAKRTRNLKHMSRYSEDSHWLFAEYFAVLLEQYQLLAGEKNSKFLQVKK